MTTIEEEGRRGRAGDDGGTSRRAPPVTGAPGLAKRDGEPRRTGADILIHQDDLGLYERAAEQCRDFRVAAPLEPLAPPAPLLHYGWCLSRLLSRARTSHAHCRTHARAHTHARILRHIVMHMQSRHIHYVYRMPMLRCMSR